MFTEQDKALIEELGLQGFSAEEQRIQLQEFYGTLELKIGMAIEDKLSDEQLAEFEKVSQAGDDAAVSAWLRQAVPDYDQLITAEMTALTQEIKQSAADFRDVMSEDL